MAQFLVAWQKVSGAEGGYVKDPEDPGGETYRGLARARQPHWPGWVIIDDAKLHLYFPDSLDDNQALRAAVEEFYRGLWGHLGLDDVESQSLADVIYDTAVNMGPARSGMFLQQAMNVMNQQGTLWPDLPEDGFIGPKTKAAMKLLRDRAHGVLGYLLCFRGTYYAKIMRRDPTQEKYALGWINRLELR